MKNNIFLAALPSVDAKMTLAQRMDACEAKRSPLLKLQWTHVQDLHVTLGFIAGVETQDFRQVALGLVSVSQSSPFMANFGAIKLYGNALVLCLEPYHPFATLHKRMNQKLIEASSQRYQFDTSKRFDPHLTLARVRNMPALNPQHRQQLISLVEEQFRSTAFLIQQAALMRHSPVEASPTYQTLQLYPFRG